MATQAALGVFVGFSALLALASAYCTCSMLDVPASLVPCLAVGWAVWICFLEREISGGLDRTTAVVRPLLALLISALVSVSISMFIFRGRVDQELARQYRMENKVQLESLNAAQSRLDQRRNVLEAVLADLRKQETDWGKTMDDELVGRTKYNRRACVAPVRYSITPRDSKRPCMSAFKKFVMI